MVNRAGLALAGLAAGCYSPSFPECVVACARPDDCAPDQTCGSDHLCASPELAGRCDELDPPDADDPPGPDARDDDPDARVDARPLADALVTASLRIDIDGRGKVKVGPPVDENCDTHDMTSLVCTYDAPLGATLSLQAMDGHGWTFAGWTGCTPASAPTCTVVVGPGTTVVGATFEDD